MANYAKSRRITRYPRNWNVLKIAANHVDALIRKVFSKPFGAHEFLNVMEANPLHLESECNFIDDFMEEEGRNSMQGYLLAQLIAKLHSVYL